MAEYEAKKFKVGDWVRIVNPNASYKPCDKIPHRIKEIRKAFTGDDCYALDVYDAINWYDDELEIVEPFRFEEGDIVKLNPDAKLGDFATKDTYHGYDIAVYHGTLDMLANDFKMSFEDEYVVGNLEFLKHTVITLKGFNGWFESALFTLVRRPEKVKKVTMAELEEKFGCKIKIVKDDEK